MRSSGIYQFRPAERSDLLLLRGWLNAPHVRLWWDDPDAQVATIAEHLDATIVKPFIALMLDRPIGYIQAYDPHIEIDHPYADQPAGTVGIDQFIGIPELTGLGHGPAMIKAFCRRLFAEGTRRVITDPDPANSHAISAYEKAGFSRNEIRDTEYGTVLLMHLDAGMETRKK